MGKTLQRLFLERAAQNIIRESQNLNLLESLESKQLKALRTVLFAIEARFFDLPHNVNLDNETIFPDLFSRARAIYSAETEDEIKSAIAGL